MSGGHFDYRESYLEYIAEQLAQDIQYNDVEYNISRSPDEPHGFQHRPETIRYLELIVNELFSNPRARRGWMGSAPRSCIPHYR